MTHDRVPEGVHRALADAAASDPPTRAEEAARGLAKALRRLERAVHEYEMGQGRACWDELLAARAQAVIALRDRWPGWEGE